MNSRKLSKRSKNSQNLVDLKKSVSLLHAYGEYDRFIELSKQFMKDRGIILKKKSKKKRKAR